MADCSADMDFPEGVEIRQLSELGVADLKAELKERNLDVTGSKSALAERLRKAIEEEGGNPDEIVVIAQEEQTGKNATPTWTARDTRQDNDGPENNLDEDDVGDGPEEPQDEQNNMQEMDILNMNAVENAENNGIPADTDEEAEKCLTLPPVEGNEENINAAMKDEEQGNGTMETEAASNLEEMTESKFVDKDEDQTCLSSKEAHENDAKDKEEPENDKVAGSCISEPLNEDRQQSQETAVEVETAVEEEHVATTDGGEETVCDIGTKGDSEAISGFMIDKDAMETDKKESGDTQNVPEETAGSESTVSVSVSEQSPASKMVNSETGSEKGEKKEETEDKAAADSSTAPKESSSVDGDDQKKSSSEEKDCKADSKDRKAPGGSDAASSSRNLFVSGLTSSTKAIDLKTLFSKYGKVVGAKVVTTAKSPGSRCFGFVAMSSTEEAAKCISRLHKTELHGSVIAVDWVRNEPTGKKPGDNSDVKKPDNEKRHSTDSKSEVKSAGEGRNGKGRNERSVVKDRSMSSDGKERSRDRKSLSKEKKDIVPFETIKEWQRQRRRRGADSGDRDYCTRSDSRERFNTKQERSSLEREYLDADLRDPEFLERETLRIEDECRREKEKISREREEVRRLQDQLHHKWDRHPVKRPYDMDGRKDEWPEKRMGMDDRYVRHQDADFRSRGRYQDDWMLERRDNSHMSGDRDNQHFSDRSDRHRIDSWNRGYNKHLNSREPADWESGRKSNRDTPWHKQRHLGGEASTSSVYNSSRQLSPPSRSRYSPSDILSTGRSRLLQEFHDNLLPKLQLRDLRGHVVEFAQHPNGSRFIQDRLIQCPADREMVLEEILRLAYPLMTDMFGNYIIQTLLELGSADQKVAVATHIRGHVLPLIQHKGGCQVIQKALEHIPSDQQIISDIVLELSDNVLSCVWDRNGKNIVHNPHGCRVIQRILEHCTQEQSMPILEELLRHSEQLIYDQCGNHVIQHVLEHGRPEDKSRIVAEVRGKVFAMSQHVYSSHVVSKCVIHASPAERALLIDEVCSQKDGRRNAVYSMMKDKYGSYVVQKMLHRADPLQREIILQKMQPDMNDLCEDSMKS